MDIEYGAKVLDSRGQSLGTINHVVRDTWTGDIRKFVVHHEPSNEDLLLSPQDVLEADDSRVILRKDFEWSATKLAEARRETTGE